MLRSKQRERWILVFFLGFTMILLGANAYVARRLYQALHYVIPGLRTDCYLCVYGLLASMMILGLLRSTLTLPPAVKNALGVYSSCYLGVLIYLLLFFLLADLLLFLWALLMHRPLSAEPKMRFFSGMAVLLLTAGVSLYGFAHAKAIQTAHYDVTLTSAPLLRERKLVLLSDIHLGAVGSEKRLEQIVAAVNAQQPDVVCIAGDIFDNDYAAIQDPERAEALLKSIQATEGVYACLGNHDAGETLPDMLALLARSGITLLQEETVVLEDGTVLLGRMDPSPIGNAGNEKRRPTAELLSTLPENAPVIVMDHNPAELTAYDGVADLVLCGHTHKGQIFPGELFTQKLFAVDYGYGMLERGTQVVVSSGAGTWGMPMRVGTDCEIAVIALHADE